MDYIQEIKIKWLDGNNNHNIIDINIEVTKKEENYNSVINIKFQEQILSVLKSDTHLKDRAFL